MRITHRMFVIAESAREADEATKSAWRALEEARGSRYNPAEIETRRARYAEALRISSERWEAYREEAYNEEQRQYRTPEELARMNAERMTKRLPLL